MGKDGQRFLLVVDSDCKWRGKIPVVPLMKTVSVMLLKELDQSVRDLVHSLEQSGASVELETAAPAVDYVAPEVALAYVELVSRVIPEAFSGVIQTNRERPKDLPPWWLHEVSGLRSDLYPTFTRLCQLELIKRKLANSDFSNVILMSRDFGFASAIHSLCHNLAVQYMELEGIALRQPKYNLGALSLVARLGFWVLRTITMTGIAKLLTPRNGSLALSRPLCCFTTPYPSMFRQTDGATDDKFLDVPSILAAKGMKSLFGVMVAVDDGHQHLSLWGYFKTCWKLRRHPSFNGIEATLIDRDLPWVDLIRGMVTGLRTALRQYRIHRDAAFQEQWVMGGVAIFDLVAPEMRMAVYRTPRYLVHMLRMRSFFDRVKPDVIITALFEFIIGRASIYAASTSTQPPLSIGVQHGPVGRKLMYRASPQLLAGTDRVDDVAGTPVPMQIILETDRARQVLVGSGYEEESLHVLGAPRLDALTYRQHFNSRKTSLINPICRVLVVFGGSDGAQIMAICGQILERSSDYHFVFRPHPRSAFRATQIHETLRGVATSAYEIDRGAFWDSLEKSDVVVATYSSAGIEAHLLGYPLIVLHLSDYASPSELLDSDGVQFANDSETLALALQNARARTVGSATATTPTLDGRSQERWAEVIAKLTRQRHIR